MINHIWTVICSKSIIDRESNNISLSNVLEQINITRSAEFEEGKAGLIPINYELVTLWMREREDQPDRIMAKITFISSSGPLPPANEFEVDLSQHIRTRTILRGNGLPFNEPGIYYFQIEVQKATLGDWEIVAKIPLQILIK
jgi:hypothetical protein